jgi:hypothetical protein
VPPGTAQGQQQALLIPIERLPEPDDRPPARVARQIVCRCSQIVWSGIDQLFGGQAVKAGRTPLDSDLAETVAHLDGRGVYSLIPSDGGPELHRRDDFHLFDRRWPALAGHHCTREER